MGDARHGSTTPPSSAHETLAAAAADVLRTGTMSAGGPQLPRVLGDSPIAVLLIDRSTGQVTFANAAALELAGDVHLPAATDLWSLAAGVTDLDGTPLASTTGPLSSIAQGRPVAGEPVRIRGTAAAAAADRGGEDERGPVVWATGFPLGADEHGDQLSLLVFLPVEQPSGAADPELVLQALRDRAVLATDISFTISDPRQEGNPLVWVNPSFSKVTGYAFDDAVGRNCKFLQGPATDPDAVAQIVTDLGAGRSTRVTLLNYRPDGTAFWNHVSISPVYDGAGELISFVGVQSDVTARVLADAERTAAFEAEQRARLVAEDQRAVAEAARARLAVMAQATTALTDSLDPAQLQHRLVELCVPLLADWATIVQVDATGMITSTTSRHRDGDAATAALAGADDVVVGRAPGADSATALAVDSGEPVAVADLAARAARGDGRARRLLPAEQDGGSLLAIPLVSRRGTWGVLVLVRAVADGFSDDDLDVAQDLGRRAGQALDNARSYTQEASVAETLQHALLPDLPSLPGVRSAARYTPASSSLAVGGDFFDLLDLPDDAVGIVVGDVVGHDLGAAAAMGQLRGLIRSESWGTDHPDPAVVLARVERLLAALRLPVLATAALLRATPVDGGWRVQCASAGHPPVLVRTPDGDVAVVPAEHDLLLGTGMAHRLPPRTLTEVALPAGSQLLLYTDGLVEQPAADRPGRRRGIDDGVAELQRTWSALPAGSPPADVVSAVHHLVVDRADDIAVLVVQLDHRPDPIAQPEASHP